MSEKKFIPLDLKYANKLYGFKQYNPTIEDNEYLLNNIYKSAKQNREQISEQSLSKLNENKIYSPIMQTPIKYKKQVETIINDIYDKEFVSWMLSKKQIRKMNQQKRLGNDQYSSRLIKQIESSKEAQTIRNQSSLCVEDLAQVLYSPKSTSHNIPEQKTKIQQFFPSKFYTLSTQPDEIILQKSTISNNINKQSYFKEYPEKIQSNQNQKQRVQSFQQRESSNERYESKQQSSKSFQYPSYSSNQTKLLTEKINHIRTESLPTSLKQIQNSAKIQTHNKLNIRLNTLENRKIQPLPLENLVINKSLDIKQYSNDTTRNDSASKQQLTFINSIKKQISQDILSDRIQSQQESKIQSQQESTKTLFNKKNKNEIY